LSQIFRGFLEGFCWIFGEFLHGVFGRFLATDFCPLGIFGTQKFCLGSFCVLENFLWRNFTTHKFFLRGVLYLKNFFFGCLWSQKFYFLVFWVSKKLFFEFMYSKKFFFSSPYSYTNLNFLAYVLIKRILRAILGTL
jgi:hypothetical protein